MTAIRKASDTMYLAPQLEPEDFAAAAAEGVAMIINNRVEGEAPGQLPDAQARAAAEAAGMAYAHVPADMAAFGPHTVAAMASAMDAAGGPVLAYCASGMRSALLWALVRARQGDAADDILADTRASGYELERFRPLMNAVAAEK